tara:strand:- start:1922 stop:2140 length:219 start_codon:yes stop_codon:yes gene_type:complete
MEEKKFIRIVKSYFEIKKNITINDQVKKYIEFDSLNRLKFITFIEQYSFKNKKINNNIDKYKNFKDILQKLK